MNNYEKAKEILKKYNQEHVIKQINRLSGEKREALINEILSIDFEELKELYNKTFEPLYVDLEEIQPIKAINPKKIKTEELSEYEKKGTEIIKANKFATITMAGGQGTRLGHEMPKGTFKIDVGENGKYLFEILVESLIRANNKFGVVIPWYIMTSKENNKDTIQFLETHKYFGYPKDNVKIFVQDERPLINEKGKVLINEFGMIKQAADGNGGIFSTMIKNGIVKDLKDKGIEWIFIGSIDNILLKPVDSLLLGLTISQNNEIGTRTILKREPKEKVGVLCKRAGKVNVIEYSELPEEIAIITDKDGELVFGESHIMCNLFSINALERAGGSELQYHIAFKKSKYLDEDGNLIIPTTSNAYKFEKFIFDAFKLFDNITILRGVREEDFAPVKNAKGEDSPETAKKLYEKYWKNK